MQNVMLYMLTVIEDRLDETLQHYESEMTTAGAETAIDSPGIDYSPD